MKTKLYILALILILTGVKKSYAQNASSLNLTLYNGNSFVVEFDDNAFTKASEELLIDGISGGKHYLKVVAESSSKPVFSGYINIPVGYNVHAVIDEYNSFDIYKKYKYRKDRRNIEIIEWGEHNENKDPGYSEDYRLISKREFAELLNIVRSKSFDNTKLEICKLSINNSYFTTDMICSMIRLLTFESYKLDLAKYAYGNTIDKRNYFRIFDTFDFESSITDLNNFIKNY